MEGKSWTFTLFLILAAIGSSLMAQNNGENLFKSTCAACHTIGGGRLIGPDLSSVSERTDQEWLIRFIRSSQQLIKEGDSLAGALFQEYNRIPMPDNDFTDEQILSIIEYIGKPDSEPSGEEVAEKEQTTTADSIKPITYTTDLVKEGLALFYGFKDFSNGSILCVSCHSIQDESIIGGGNMSLDLTKSYSKLGPAGINAILANPPFPVMKIAMRNKKLTDNESLAIVAMLQYTDERSKQKSQHSTDGLIFAIFGLVFAMFILIFIYILYDDRNIPSHP
jgi:mono/diheme cytochrome c family protein